MVIFYVVIIVGILIGALSSKKKTLVNPMFPTADKKSTVPPAMYNQMPKRQAKENTIEQHPKLQNRADIPTAFVPSTPEEEGMHSVSIPPITDENVYSTVSHIGLADAEDWRKAIIAHEILKRKF